jgi:Predicted aminopeptidases
MPGSPYSGPFKPLSTAEVEIRENLKRHVWALAGKIGERNLWCYQELKASADYIEATLAGQGYRVAKQEYKVEGMAVNNLETEVRGISQPEQIVIVGAHYDSVYGCPGANDNATGIAAVLEIARLLKQHKPGRTLRFVAFVNEEPPFFMTGEMGSVIYARRSKQRGEQIAAMLSLETIGYYSDAAGSQHYPAPLSLFYPDTANFIGFVGNISSRELVRRAIKTFRATTEFPSEGGALPGWIPGVGWSDHWSFWQEGYEAIMITDTALFRYQHYHTSDDTPDKIDFDRMARVVAGLVHVVADLTGAQ